MAVVVQSMLVLYYLAMGLGWFGLFYVANVVQGVAFLGLAILALVKRPALALAIPAISFAMMLGCLHGDQFVKATICSPSRLSAAAQLGPIPGHTESPEFEHEWGRCVARFNSGLPQATVMDHYRSRALRAGWQVDGPQSDRKAVVSNTTTTITVVVNWNDQGMYLMTVGPRHR